MKKILDTIKKNPYWIIAVIGFLLFYLFTMYGDILITYEHGFLLLDCIKEGDFFNFYNRSAVENSYNMAAYYSLPMYIWFALVTLPCWILTRFFGVAAYSVGCLLWLKLAVIIPLIGCVILMKKILEDMKFENISFGIFYIFTSLLVVYPAFAVVQYDTPSLFLSLLGIYMYSKEDKLSLKTLLIFSLAISLKIFALFPFILIVLLKEKRIFHIIKNLVLSLAVTVLCNLIFMFSNTAETKAAQDGFISGKIAQLLEKSLPGSLTNISIFFVIFIIACLIAYFQKSENSTDCITKSFWLIALFYWDFFTFFMALPYWIILLSPFLLLVVLSNKKMFRLNYLLEEAFEAMAMILYGTYFFWVYWGDYSFSHLLLKNIPRTDLLGIPSFNSLINGLGLVEVLPLFQTVFAVASICILIFNNPWKPLELKWNKEDNIAIHEKWSIVFRLFAMYILLIFNAVIVFVI